MLCGGTGAELHQTCPQAYPDATAFEAWELHVAAKEYGVLPEAGGFLDQCAWLVDAWRVIHRVESQLMSSEPSRG